MVNFTTIDGDEVSNATLYNSLDTFELQRDKLHVSRSSDCLFKVSPVLRFSEAELFELGDNHRRFTGDCLHCFD